MTVTGLKGQIDRICAQIFLMLRFLVSLMQFPHLTNKGGKIGQNVFFVKGKEFLVKVFHADVLSVQSSHSVMSEFFNSV